MATAIEAVCGDVEVSAELKVDWLDFFVLEDFLCLEFDKVFTLVSKVLDLAPWTCAQGRRSPIEFTTRTMSVPGASAL